AAPAPPAASAWSIGMKASLPPKRQSSRPWILPLRPIVEAWPPAPCGAAMPPPYELPAARPAARPAGARPRGAPAAVDARGGAHVGLTGGEVGHVPADAEAHRADAVAAHVLAG